MIGHGSSKQGSHGVHGAPLGAADLKSVKAKFGFDPEQVRTRTRYATGTGVWYYICSVLYVFVCIGVSVLYASLCVKCAAVRACFGSPSLVTCMHVHTV